MSHQMTLFVGNKLPNRVTILLFVRLSILWAILFYSAPGAYSQSSNVDELNVKSSLSTLYPLTLTQPPSEKLLNQTIYKNEYLSKDIKLSLSKIETLSDAGDTIAQTFWALLIIYRKVDVTGGAPFQLGTELLEKACQSSEHNGTACAYFAWFSKQKDEIKLPYYDKACSNGSIYGCDRAAWIYMSEKKSLNYDKSLELFSKACESQYEKSCLAISIAEQRAKKSSSTKSNFGFNRFFLSSAEKEIVNYDAMISSAPESELSAIVALADEKLRSPNQTFIKHYNNKEYRKAAELAMLLISTEEKANLASGFIDKGAYGRDDSINVSELRRKLNQQAKITVALVSRGESKPHCSGLYLKDKFVLTAAHCLSSGGYPLIGGQGIDVLFGFENARNVPIKIKVQNVAGPKHLDIKDPTSIEKLDYAILELEDLPPDELISESCLMMSKARYGEPIYGLGYPNKGVLKYHANGTIYLPHLIESGKPFEKLVKDLAAHEYRRTLNLIPVAENNSSKTSIGLQEQAIESFIITQKLLANSYKKNSQTGDLELFHTRLGRPTEQVPSIRVELDLSRGDSGAPIFHERTNCVIGILKGGQSDNKKGMLVGWEVNESVTPIKAVYDDLLKSSSNNDLIATFESMTR